MKNRQNHFLRKNWGLAAVLALALWLRVYRAGEVPHGLNADEAALGYNAYSLLQTGRDEHGHPWPIHFESFADFKPGGYIYLLLPLVEVFGLQVWVVRLPALVAGVAAVWLIFALVRALFPQEKLAAFLAALGLAISPWHVQFSRGGWETNVGTTFLVGGSLLVWQGLKKNKFNRQLAGLMVFILAAYTYHSMRIVGPVLLFTILGLQVKTFLADKKKAVIFLVAGVALCLPLLIDLVGGGGVARFSGVGITGDIGPHWSANRMRGEHADTGVWWVRLLHNRPLSYGVKVAQNWAAHFNAEFLFIDGDKIRRSNAPNIGQLYWLDALGLVAGLAVLAKKWRREWIFLFVWIVIAPLPAALTLQSPHALRTQSLVVPLMVVLGLGWSGLWRQLKHRQRVVFGILFVVVSAWQVGYFLDAYLVHYPYEEPQVWEQGFDQLVPYLASVEDRYDRIYVTEQYDQPYILFLFFRRYPPAEFQSEHILTQREKFGFSTVRDWRRYHFENIDWERLPNGEKLLVVGTDEEIPDSANIIKEILFTNGMIAFQIAVK